MFGGRIGKLLDDYVACDGLLQSCEFLMKRDEGTNIRDFESKAEMLVDEMYRMMLNKILTSFPFS